MKIKDLLQQSDRKVLFSCEIFPPKKDTAFRGVFETVDAITELGADFISVTYGAAGSTSKKTVEVASYIQDTQMCIRDRSSGGRLAAWIPFMKRSSPLPKESCCFTKFYNKKRRGEIASSFFVYVLPC